jgi:hypothetical protein
MHHIWHSTFMPCSHPYASQPDWTSVSFIGEFLPNPYLKNMISTYKKDFPWKKWPKFAKFWKTILPIARFLLLVPVHSQKCWKILIFSYFHISACDQIWLNHFEDDNHLGYITKLEKETLDWTTTHKCTTMDAYCGHDDTLF